MKREFLGSLAVHFIIIIFVVLLSSSTARVKGYPTVYRVNLVSMPKALTAAVTEVKTLKAQEKGVAFKPVKKAAKKEISPDKQVSEDLKKEETEKSTKDESKPGE